MTTNQPTKTTNTSVTRIMLEAKVIKHVKGICEAQLLKARAADASVGPFGLTIVELRKKIWYYLRNNQVDGDTLYRVLRSLEQQGFIEMSLNESTLIIRIPTPTQDSGDMEPAELNRSIRSKTLTPFQAEQAKQNALRYAKHKASLKEFNIVESAPKFKEPIDVEADQSTLEDYLDVED